MATDAVGTRNKSIKDTPGHGVAQDQGTSYEFGWNLGLAGGESLVELAARARVDERELERGIYRAANNEGLSQRRISDIVQRSQATVQRILRRINAEPELLDATPMEIIDRRTAGLITTEKMMEYLLNWKYSFGSVVRIDDVATDAYSSGDWDDIELAYYRDQLTDDEFQTLARRQIEKTAQ
ncbi:helix-turn-helix domain-containing protein [Mycolicibacterium fluoranthenivorans]|uniref:ParB-like chromosome segregation protein Spo0J n=1 Tax=Mycolicibacterium fluoranthenivorans TaxID=258505 RepID=A0A7X5U2I6_9MYCO|nr:helix-turn-helix domain-containing protein [Mycolicibacterium fluoranthenivorans]NIH97237.1 ParB-like chromosome segregation protein Spo0J [Mycolicibacterium fluoranthenivorans]